MHTRLAAMTVATALVTTNSLAQEAEKTETLLDRVVISAGKEKVAIDTPQSVTVVDQEDMEAEQPTTVGDVLTDLPGVKAIGSDRVMGESFNIRGIGALGSSDENRLIVTVDGATKFHEQYRMGSLFTEPDLYKQIEVLRGPASSTLYGSGALGGVINLTTKDASDYLKDGDEFAFREKLEFDSNRKGFLTSSTVAAEPMKNLELLGSFIFRRSSEFRDGAGERISGSDFKAPSGLVKGKYRFGDDDHEVRASYQHWTTESNADLAQTNTSSDFGDIERTVVDQTGIFGYSYTPINNPLIDLDITFNYTKSDVDQTNASNQGAFGNSALFEPVHYAYEIWQTRAENTAEFSGQDYENYFTSGIEYAYQIRTADKAARAASPGNGVTFHPGGESQRIGIYVQNEWVYKDRLTLIPGIRADFQKLQPGDAVTVTREKVSETGLAPKLAAHYKLDNNWGVFGSVAYTERLPVLDEIYDNSSSNLNLTPETSMNYEVGLSYAVNNVLQDKDAFSAKGTVFHNKINDLIERASNTSTYYNVGKSEIEGIELESSYNSSHLFSRAAYTMIRGENTETGLPLNSIPADELALTIGGRVPDMNLEFGWRGVLAAQQEDRNGTTVRTGGYMVNDIFSSWKPQTGTLGGTEVRFGISNIFDREYKEHLAGDKGKGRTAKLTLARTF